MNWKKRAASAVIASTLPWGAAQAQGSVTIYGLLDVAMGSTSTGNGAKSISQLASGVGAGSRLGFRGSEDLGGGLLANFALESGIGVDNGGVQQGGAMWGRQAFVGLSSSTGQWGVSLGRQYAPSLSTFIAADALGQQYWGNTVGTGYGNWQAPLAPTGAGGHQATTRINNSLLGRLQAGNFVLRGMVAAGDETSTDAGHLVSLGTVYSDGPLTLSVTATRFRQYVQQTTAGAPAKWQDEVVAGGNYNFGPFKLYAGYYGFNPSEANRPPLPTSAIGAALDVRFLKTSSCWVGTQVPIGMGTLMAQVMRSKLKFSGPDGQATTVAIAYDYPLSKRTGVYFSYGHVDNDDHSTVSLYSTTQAVFANGAGASVRAASLGMRHSF